jgi:hypothetical protein
MHPIGAALDPTAFAVEKPPTKPRPTAHRSPTHAQDRTASRSAEGDTLLTAGTTAGAGSESDDDFDPQVRQLAAAPTNAPQPAPNECEATPQRPAAASDQRAVERAACSSPRMAGGSEAVLIASLSQPPEQVGATHSVGSGSPAPAAAAAQAIQVALC